MISAAASWAPRVTPKQIVSLLDRIVGLGLPIGMTNSLRNYDGKAGFTLAQGQ